MAEDMLHYNTKYSTRLQWPSFSEWVPRAISPLSILPCQQRKSWYLEWRKMIRQANPSPSSPTKRQAWFAREKFEGEKCTDLRDRSWQLAEAFPSPSQGCWSSPSRCQWGCKCCDWQAGALHRREHSFLRNVPGTCILRGLWSHFLMPLSPLSIPQSILSIWKKAWLHGVMQVSNTWRWLHFSPLSIRVVRLCIITTRTAWGELTMDCDEDARERQVKQIQSHRRRFFNECWEQEEHEIDM